LSQTVRERVADSIPGTLGLYTFQVEEIVHRWYHSSAEPDIQRRREALMEISAEKIMEVQHGQRPEACANLMELGSFTSVRSSRRQPSRFL